MQKCFRVVEWDHQGLVAVVPHCNNAEFEKILELYIDQDIRGIQNRMVWYTRGARKIHAWKIDAYRMLTLV